jgi:ribosome-associated toxin RatA of RatAB toxin-antitoxin module
VGLAAMKFEHVAVVDAEPERVFALTQDYARRLTWDPFLRRAELVGGASAPGVGVRAWCVAFSGLGMETEYVSFAPPHIAAVRMTRGPWVLESFGGAWEFSAAEDGATRVAFRYQFRTRPRWLSWLIEPLTRRWFSWETRKRVLALQAALARAPGRAGPREAARRQVQPRTP